MGSHRSPARLGILAAVLVLLAGSDEAEARRRCPGGRYLVPSTEAALITEGGRTTGDVVVVAGDQVSIDSGCEPVTARLRAHTRFTVVTATWPSCTGVAGKVRLRARIDAGTCDAMKGVLKVRPTQRTRSFAARLSVCGDGVVDAGNREECEPPSIAGCNAACLEAARCGNGVVEGFEGCDDGNHLDCDGCRGDCSRSDDICGDGIVECDEDCDGSAAGCDAGEVCDQDCFCG